MLKNVIDRQIKILSLVMNYNFGNPVLVITLQSASLCLKMQGRPAENRLNYCQSELLWVPSIATFDMHTVVHKSMLTKITEEKKGDWIDNHLCETKGGGACEGEFAH